MRRALILFFFMALLTEVRAQEFKPKAKFLDDTLKLGFPAQYALSIEYPGEWQIFFPDSTDDFGIFEYHSRKAYKTFSRDSLTVDSVVYDLVSFELDSVQGLSLPVYRLYKGDTLEMMSNGDSIILLEYIETVPQELDLKENALLRFIPDIFNKKLFLIIAAVILAILILIALLFGKKILNRWRIYLMSKKHKKFLEQFDALLEQSRTETDKEVIESANARWKDYLTELEKKPYNTYSTRDFVKHLNNEELIISLKQIDAHVYGGIRVENIMDHLIQLKHFAEDRFEIRKKEVQDA